MAGDVKALKSYLVSLGFDANMSEFAKFESVLRGAKSLVKSSTVDMAFDLLKWQAAVTGVFFAVSGAIVGTIGKVAMADQEFRLFGQRMLLNTEQARSLKITLDALNQPIEAIAFDPELHARYEQLRKDQLLLSAGLGGDFEGTMKQIRDVMFEFTRLEVEFKYFTFSVAKNIFQALGGGDFTKQLQRLNDWIIQNIPEWSAKFAKYLVPILKDTWRILKDLGVLFLDLGTIFTNFIGIISGDSSLKSKTFDFEKFADAVDRVARAVAWALEKLIALEDFIARNPGLIGGAALGARAGLFFGPEGALAGGAIGALGGIAYDALSPTVSNAPAGGGGAGAGVTADQARALARQIGGNLGVDPSIIYAQFAHETGNFTNRGARSLNNLAGIENSDGTYKSFGSVQAFGDYYTDLIRRKYSGALGATSTDAYASALKQGGYFADTLGNYENGMRSFQGSYAGGGNSSASYSFGDINIMQPNASPEQIKNAVKSAVAEHTALTTKRSLAQTKTIYA
jgi:hypothetical protein